MDAVDFLKERKRRCEVYFEKTECKECPLGNMGCWTVDFCADDSCEKVIATVEQWLKEHPRKTRQSEFLKMFPNVSLDGNGIINISPCRVDPKQYPFNGKDCGRFSACSQCRREFWMQEVE